MAELYSRPLSPEAKLKLIDFIQAYIETMMVAEVDEKAEIAKTKAIEVLKTDIDILVFITTLLSFYEVAISLINKVERKTLSSKEAAELIVEIAEKARQMDKARRPGGS